MGKQLSTQSAEITALIKKINKAHALTMSDVKEVQKAKQRAVKNAISIGGDLLNAKSKCKHGQWEVLFCGSNPNSKQQSELGFEFSSTQAVKYIRAAKFPEQTKIAVKENESFNLNKVYAELSDATEEKEKELIGQHSKVADDEWNTPQQYIESARNVLRTIDIDPASNSAAQEIVKANTYYTIDDSGLDHPWVGNVFLNPPFSSVIQKFAEKVVSERKCGNLESAIILTNNGSDTNWWSTILSVSSGVCLTSSRIRFLKGGEPQNNNSKGQCFFYVGSNFAAFKREFSQHGNILETTNNEVNNEQ